MYSIHQLEQFSGIKAHTIRIWEKRYNALNPQRTDGNTRFYDNAQLKRLLNIVGLLQNKNKVSELCILPDNTLEKMVSCEMNTFRNATKSTNFYISQIIAAAINFDEETIDRILSKSIKVYGVKKTYARIIYSLFVQTGMMWRANDLRLPHEHFITNVVRKKIVGALERLPKSKSDADKWVLFLPENEFHEIGLLMANYILQELGQRVIYLGANVPIDSVIDTVRFSEAGYVMFFLVHNDTTESVQKFLNELYTALPNTQISIAGRVELIGRVSLFKNMQWIQSPDGLEKIVLTNNN